MCVIHRLTKLNKKTETSPQSLVAEVLEPKKIDGGGGGEAAESSIWKTIHKSIYSLLLLKLAEINNYSFLHSFQSKVQKENAVAASISSSQPQCLQCCGVFFHI